MIILSNCLIHDLGTWFTHFKVKLFGCLEIPGNFNSVDKTQHIMAAANNSNIVFWDLRKMKQRSEFKDSFDGEITFIRF